MSELKFGINRMVAPVTPLESFLDIVSETGAVGVELRNDLPSGFDVTDKLGADRVREMLASRNLTVRAINAVQHFNLPEAFDQALAETRRLIGFAQQLGNPAILMCPHNAVDDKRSPVRMAKDTRDALKKLRPVLNDAGLTGLVEPLGFPESSLRSASLAAEIIGEIGDPVYRITIDTFHFAVAGMDTAMLGTPAIPVELVGLVHLSGVTSAGDVAEFRDPDRIYVDADDRVNNLRTVQKLVTAGYDGVLSFEPFSPSVHGLSREQTVELIKTSMRYIRGEIST